MFRTSLAGRALALASMLPVSAFADDPALELELAIGAGEAVSTEVTEGPLATELDLDQSRLLGAALYYRWHPAWALGLEFASDRADVESLDPLPASGKLTVNSLMLNAEYRFGGDSIRPFIGAGLGAGSLSADATAGALALSDDGGFFMAQVFAGARYRVSERFALHAQLRYRYADDVKVSLADSLSIPVDYEKFLILIGANLAF